MNPRHRSPIAWLRRRQLFTDPGGFRFVIALRTLITAVAAVIVTLALSVAVPFDGVPAAIFAGMMTLFASAAATPGRSGIGRAAGLLAVVPLSLALMLAAVLDRDDWVMVPVLAALALLTVLSGRLGARAAALGQLGFVAFFFGAILNVGPGSMPGMLIAGGVSVVCSTAVELIHDPATRRRVLGAGVRGYLVRLDRLLDVATGATDPGRAGQPTRILQRRLLAEADSLRQAGTVLSGRLDHMTPGPSGQRSLLAGEVMLLRLRILDVDIAAQHLVDLLSQSSRSHDDPIVLAAFSELDIAVRRLRDLDAHDLLATGSGADPAPYAMIETAPAAPPAATSAPPTGKNATRKSIQSALATGASLMIGSLVSATHHYWAAMPAYQVLQNSDGETRMRAIQRVLGTLTGAAAGFALAVFFEADLWVDVALLAVCVFAMGYVRGVSATWFAAWQTGMFALQYDLLGKLSTEMVHIRVIETVIGSVIAVLVAAVVLPIRTRSKVRQAMTDAVQAIERLAAVAVARRTEGAAAEDAGVDGTASKVMEMMQAMNRVAKLAAPMRLDPGAWRLGGIEAQMMSLWCAAHSAHALAVEEAPDVPAELRRLEGALGEFARAFAADRD